MTTSTKPSVLLLIDTHGWAFETIAQAIRIGLDGTYNLEIATTLQKPTIDENRYDIIHTFFDREQYHLPFLHGKAKIVKSIYSHYWQVEGMTALELYDRYFRDAHAITVPNMKLAYLLSDVPPPVHIFPEGVDTRVFRPDFRPLTGVLKVGWAGNPTRYIKRFQWLKEATAGICDLAVAGGNFSQEQMVDFYNSIDVIACTSMAEGSPRPILEGMACGAFPVSFDVGIVPELIDNQLNGLIVRDESAEGFRQALLWCAGHLDHIRRLRQLNANRIAQMRSWKQTLPHIASIYASVLS